MEFVAATGNRDKLEEFRRILEPLGATVVSPGELGISAEVEETGETFLENAALKARAYYRLIGKPALADDSGLCVDALEGRPGVHSARYHGDADYPEKIAALLEELAEVSPERRTCRFVSAICCVLDDETEVCSQECCEGAIGYEPKGENGFGYDPIFYMGERSMAQMSDREKDAVSHRGKALRAFAAKLKDTIKPMEEA